MNYFFGFDVYLKEKIDWMFNLNHLFLLALVSLIIVGLYFALHAKTEKGKKVTKLTLAGVLLVLEVGRTVYKIASHLSTNDTLAGFNWAWNISFQMCAIMCWTTIATLIASCFVKSDNKVLIIFKNILFGAAMLGGILTFIYPDCISTDRSLLHFVNFQTIIVHALLIFVPIYLLKINELNVRLKNLWMPALGFIGVAAISMAVSQISAQNFAFALENPLFTDIGLKIAFPWHLPLTFLIVFAITAIYYSVFELIHFVKNRKLPAQPKEKKKYTAMDYFYMLLPYATAVLVSFLILFLPVMMGAKTGANLDYKEHSIHSWLGILILLPLFLQIGVMILTEYLKKKKAATQSATAKIDVKAK